MPNIVSQITKPLLFSSLLFLPIISDATLPVNKPKVHLEQVFAASDQLVWSKFGRFCSIEEWQSLVASCLIEERADGIYRIVLMRDDSAFVERLEELSHPEKTFKYSILSGPLAVENYRSELKVKALDDHRSKIIWKAWYDLPDGNDEVTQNLKTLFENGLKGMNNIIDTTTRM